MPTCPSQRLTLTGAVLRGKLTYQPSSSSVIIGHFGAKSIPPLLADFFTAGYSLSSPSICPAPSCLSVHGIWKVPRVRFPVMNVPALMIVPPRPTRRSVPMNQNGSVRKFRRALQERCP